MVRITVGIEGMACGICEEGGASDFAREYTLAFRGPYCDYGYKKRKKM